MGSIKFASIIVTYRCNARCHMCNTWAYPSKHNEEIGLNIYEKLPLMNTINVTGGEPFLREDLNEIISILKKKTTIRPNNLYWKCQRLIKEFLKKVQYSRSFVYISTKKMI